MAIPNFQDFYDAGRAEAVLRRPDLTFLDGDVSDMFMAAAAAMADRLTGYAAAGLRDTYLDGARGDALTQLCSDHWGIVREAAVAATVTLALSRPTFTAGAGTILAGSVVATQFDRLGQSVQYTLDLNVVWGATDLTKAATATAQFTGASGNALGSQVTRWVTAPFDSTIAVTNPSPAAGGSDEETDAALRERTRRFPTTLRRGTLAALEYGAKTVPGVAIATAVEGDTGICTVYIADVAGSSNPSLVTSVQAELQNWRAAGALVYAAGGTLYAGPGTAGAGRLIITLSLTVRTGVDVAALVANVQAAVKARLDQQGVGEILYRDVIKQAAANVDRTAIVKVDVVAPAADVQPGGDEIIRTTVADITVA